MKLLSDRRYNFTKKFILEPRLEGGIDPGVASELQALDVKQICFFFGGVNPEGKLIGFDDKVRGFAKRKCESKLRRVLMA